MPNAPLFVQGSPSEYQNAGLLVPNIPHVRILDLPAIYCCLGFQGIKSLFSTRKQPILDGNIACSIA